MVAVLCVLTIFDYDCSWCVPCCEALSLRRPFGCLESRVRFTGSDTQGSKGTAPSEQSHLCSDDRMRCAAACTLCCVSLCPHYATRMTVVSTGALAPVDAPAPVDDDDVATASVWVQRQAKAKASASVGVRMHARRMRSPGRDRVAIPPM